MTDLATIFAELGISHYLHDFVEQGFDTWDTILDITESDFDALGVKLGHRRKLQRKIANARGLSSDRALASPRNTPNEDRPGDDNKPVGTKADGKDGNGSVAGAKRKYRRHPKPDEHAPERPPSAYVIFSNKMREDLKGRNLSFTEIAKLVGENWQNLSPGEKDPYEQQAFSAKERYNNELAEYKKTDNFVEYSQYLAEFKARHANPQQTSDADASKRPKLEAHTSVASTGTSSSGTSQQDSPVNQPRVEQPLANGGQWQPVTTPTSPIVSKPTQAFNGQTTQAVTSPTILPGYRDSIFPSLPWRDAQRDEVISRYQPLPSIASVKDRQTSFSAAPHHDPLNPSGPQQHARRTEQSHPAPLLKSESTNRSTVSTGSTISSIYYSPRTPMDPPMERALPIPSIYSQKPFKNQLPPIRPPSLSPQPSLLGHPQQSPKLLSKSDYASSIPSLRGYGPVASHHTVNEHPDFRNREYINSNLADDTILDPVSALLRAGEIVNQNSRGHAAS
ncbi:hypothetical protein WAI453_013421 [Rhynchosporium graminicola]|uniref:Related to nonhistone chromosomal protein n=1 Tax=Rhynchosporium graminicola TaxID=2792576 RepID=A0A1E1K9I4_9HELO|nr:related to nonhistone chromosomal protein [Rhynchosporium commune]